MAGTRAAKNGDGLGHFNDHLFVQRHKRCESNDVRQARSQDIIETRERRDSSRFNRTATVIKDAGLPEPLDPSLISYAANSRRSRSINWSRPPTELLGYVSLKSRQSVNTQAPGVSSRGRVALGRFWAGVLCFLDRFGFIHGVLGSLLLLTRAAPFSPDFVDPYGATFYHEGILSLEKHAFHWFVPTRNVSALPQGLSLLRKLPRNVPEPRR
ncbi:hypothetical protein B0H16DRAFT_1461193 [Mycena metata]|uniref:Uncharacterized protein n=1 Tax=Mycena metata TaxID=1033252 RepID=A0AAD7ITH3_9AGAR|nr:hypothetical protein B0H16DRAFT_1461193 [Mycena metata]